MKSQGKNVTLVFDKKGMIESIKVSQKKNRLMIKDQTVIFSSEIMGEAVTVLIDGNVLGKCVVGKGSKSVHKWKEEEDNNWLWLMVGSVTVFIILGLVYLANKKYRYQPLINQEIELT